MKLIKANLYGWDWGEWICFSAHGLFVRGVARCCMPAPPLHCWRPTAVFESAGLAWIDTRLAQLYPEETGRRRRSLAAQMASLCCVDQDLEVYSILSCGDNQARKMLEPLIGAFPVHRCVPCSYVPTAFATTIMGRCQKSAGFRTEPYLEWNDEQLRLFVQRIMQSAEYQAAVKGTVIAKATRHLPLTTSMSPASSDKGARPIFGRYINRAWSYVEAPSGNVD